MSCDIHTVAQKREGNKWVNLTFEPFDWRSYGMFGFLADVKNYSFIPPLAEARGFPPDFVAGKYVGDHSFSWLSIDELNGFNYDAEFEDRRCSRQEPGFINGAADAGEGHGVKRTYREFLGDDFFSDLEKLKTLGAERVVFGFDN